MKTHGGLNTHGRVRTATRDIALTPVMLTTVGR